MLRNYAAFGCALIIFLLGACVPGESHGSYKVATAPGTVSALSRSDGLLAGKTNGDGTACFWIGDGQDRTWLVWPQGYSAEGNPLTIVDQNGRVLATVGKRVALGGRRDEGPATVQGCTGAGQVWVVGGLTKLE
jgi:hypothetical protein